MFPVKKFSSILINCFFPPFFLPSEAVAGKKNESFLLFLIKKKKGKKNHKTFPFNFFKRNPEESDEARYFYYFLVLSICTDITMIAVDKRGRKKKEEMSDIGQR